MGHLNVLDGSFYAEVKVLQVRDMWGGQDVRLNADREAMAPGLGNGEKGLKLVQEFVNHEQFQVLLNVCPHLFLLFGKFFNASQLQRYSFSNVIFG